MYLRCVNTVLISRIDISNSGMGSNGLLYDSSCSNVNYADASTFLWPYTLDYVPTASCDNGDAPDKPFRGNPKLHII